MKFGASHCKLGGKVTFPGLILMLGKGNVLKRHWKGDTCLSDTITKQMVSIIRDNTYFGQCHMGEGLKTRDSIILTLESATWGKVSKPETIYTYFGLCHVGEGLETRDYKTYFGQCHMGQGLKTRDSIILTLESATWGKVSKPETL